MSYYDYDMKVLCKQILLDRSIVCKTETQQMVHPSALNRGGA